MPLNVLRRLPSRAAATALIALWGWIGARSFVLFRADRSLAEARYALENHDPAGARLLADAGLRWNPREPELYSLRAALNGRAGDWDAAAEDIINSLLLSPHTARFYEEAGGIEEERGNTADAAAYLEKAVFYLPLNPWSRLRLARLRERANQWPAAEIQYEKVLELLGRPDVMENSRDTAARLETLVAQKLEEGRKHHAAAKD